MIAIHTHTQTEMIVNTLCLGLETFFLKAMVEGGEKTESQMPHLFIKQQQQPFGHISHSQSQVWLLGPKAKGK